MRRAVHGCVGGEREGAQVVKAGVAITVHLGMVGESLRHVNCNALERKRTPLAGEEGCGTADKNGCFKLLLSSP